MTDTVASARSFDRPQSNVRGIAAMVAAMCCFVISDTFAKLASAAVPVSEVIAVRGLMSTTFMGVAFALQNTGRLLDLKFSRAWAVRIAGEMTAALTFIPALAHMPMQNVVSIAQAAPLALTAAGALVFGERVGWRRWTATIIGFLGVLLIVRPGTDAFTWWSIAALACVFAVVVRDIATRQMAHGVPATLLTASTAAGVTVAGLGLSAFGAPWIWPTGTVALYLAASGIAVAGGYYFSIHAVRLANLSTVAPFRYTIIPLSVVIAATVWGGWPDLLTVTGICIIVLAGLYTFLRERKTARNH
jgi:drug/metabolite transporter (DMT)-like permease